MSLLQKAINWSVAGLVGYAALIALLCLPGPQRGLVYLNWIVWPLGADFSRPEQFGYVAGTARQVQLVTKTNIRLGAWHVLPNELHEQAISAMENNDTRFEAIYNTALTTHETVLYLHGNAATRGFSRRVDMTAKYMNANVFVVDYRGFADSEGTPSESGLVEDAWASWQWLIEHGASPDSTTILGHSLGTGVASQLTANLAAQAIYLFLGISPKALILKAPFSSIPEVVFEFRLLHFIPLFWPLSLLSNGYVLVWHMLYTHFDSFEAIKHVSCPILFLHGNRDLQIPAAHARRLFWSAVVHRSRKQDGSNLALPDETPIPTDAAANALIQDSQPRDVESMAKHIAVSKEVWPNEGYQLKSEQLHVTYVELKEAHHDNLQDFERMWQSVGQIVYR
ncbi:Alpha/Beta hydrolase protein [Syncephalis fuscata]|nr:Alpha/Beta hydrolase protein [Syncephalis fuscata]